MRPRNVLFGTLPLMLAASALFAETPSKTVDYSDLDLQKPKHVALLYRRIESAAGYVCRPLVGSDAEHVIRFRKCVDEAVERAVNDVHQPLLSERYATLTGARILSPLLTPLNR